MLSFDLRVYFTVLFIHWYNFFIYKNHWLFIMYDITIIIYNGVVTWIYHHLIHEVEYVQMKKYVVYLLVKKKSNILVLFKRLWKMSQVNIEWNNYILCLSTEGLKFGCNNSITSMHIWAVNYCTLHLTLIILWPWNTSFIVSFTQVNVFLFILYSSVRF